MSEQVNVDAANDEAALDRELEASIASVKAGQTIGASDPAGNVTPTGQATEQVPAGSTDAPAPTGASAPTGATGSTGGAPGDPQPTGATGALEIRIPNKGKHESDEAYEKRVELFDLVKRRRAATTQEAKAAISAEITKAKGELKTLGGTERFTQTRTEAAPTRVPGPTGASGAVDPQLEADKSRLRQLGGLTKEDVEELMENARHEGQVRSDLESFVEKHPELKDQDMREVFFQFVESEYAWQGKSGKELSTTLELAFDNMFRPSESVQERVLKGADVQGKVNAMQFPGGTGSKTTYSPEMQKSIDEMKAAGLSEEAAVELLS